VASYPTFAPSFTERQRQCTASRPAVGVDTDLMLGAVDPELCSKSSEALIMKVPWLLSASALPSLEGAIE
jgi:hypothetical protein